MTDLLPLIAKGDRDAAASCVKKYGPLVWSLARRFFSDARDAEDATQEAFVELWTRAKHFDPALSPEKAFVALVARRKFIDVLRKKKRRPLTEPIVVDASAHDVDSAPSTYSDGDGAKLKVALEKLRPEVRNVLLLASGEGLSHAEVAKATGLPIGTVKSHARRGLLRLREMLSERTAAEVDS
jgi:RNA polymerase sigma factor (sigma-70 family)